MTQTMTQTSSAFEAGPELLRDLERRARPIDLEENRILFRQGEAARGVYLVRKGMARLTRQSGNEFLLVVEAGPGSLLGVPAVIGSKPYSLTAEAMEGAELSLLPAEYFVYLMHTEPMLSFRVLKVLAEEVRFARDAFAH